jgi:hypothetical protein
MKLLVIHLNSLWWAYWHACETYEPYFSAKYSELGPSLPSTILSTHPSNISSQFKLKQVSTSLFKP